ncbi:MAG: hypothetical protein IKZ46_05755 [Victivallales bacterium]|nr:hypothetical protein [Victivallales bacterium]
MLTWHTSKAAAFEAAAASDKLVLMVGGRDTCMNTNYFRNTVCETADIKATLLAGYELWYTNVDTSSESSQYRSGLGNTLPFIAIIDPVQDNRLKGHGGPMSITDARIFFDPCTPIFSLSEYTVYTTGTTQMLELSTLRGGLDIRYRFDDTAPTISDMLYTEAIPLTATTTVSARAFENGEPVSTTETMTFTFQEQVATPVINRPPNGYCFLPYNATATCATPGATIRYRLDNYIPSASSLVLPAEGVSITAYTPFIVVAFKDGMKASDYAFTYLDVVNDIDGASAVVTGDVQVGSPSRSTSWLVQNSTYNSAPSALQSGDISSGSSSIMAAKVNGPGRLSFCWRASTEDRYRASLSLYIDGDNMASIYGSDNWGQKEFTITGSGDHVLVWTYYKYSNFSGSGGYAWVDDIVWTPIDADTLLSIAIDGAASIASGSTESYTCTATWGDDSQTTVTPTWSLSSTNYASVDATGKVTNKNTTGVDQTVTLNAVYTHNGVTETASKIITLTKRSLISIAVDGPDYIDSGASATYSCTATWSDGETTEVRPTWDLNSWTYANINTNGRVVNQNTTEKDQTVTLTAAYTFNGVSKTVTKNVTLKKRELQSITINGMDTIYAGDTVTYSCSASWSDRTTTVVIPAWSLSSTQYASVDADGKVTHRNMTDKDQTVTLTASYTVGDVTKTATKVITLAKRTLTYLAINGDSTISSGSSATYTGTATWSDGATTTVTPTWSLSNSAIASVDTTGKVTNKNTTDSDYNVTLTATYTQDGITKTASKTITLVRRTLASIAINGNNTISSGGKENYTCTATWSDGATTTVTPTWSLSSSEYASIDAEGKMTNKNTTETEKEVTLKASYEYGSITKTASKVVTLSKRLPASMTIVGDDTISNGSILEYVCMVTWSDETVSRVTPDWSLSSTDYASVDVNGRVRNLNSTDNDQSVTLTANFSFSGVTKTASKTITLAKRILVSIDIEGDDTISVGGMVAYICKAKWGYGGTTEVTPTWSVSNTDFASVDAAGKVTNRNTTAYDHAVMLAATYTYDGVTKTASKNITLTKRTLVSIAIEGSDMIPSGGVVAYTCKATWDDADTTAVTPTWTLSSTTYASIDANGWLKNMNSTPTEQTVSLTANYTVGDVTKTATKIVTLAKRTLASISVNGDDIIPSCGISTYICTATWNIGESTTVIPTWSLSSTNYASVGTDGKVINKNATDNDQTVTLTASYTVGDVTKTATKVVTLAKRTLTDIAIDGDTVIPTGGTATYTCTATWSYGDSTAITPAWSLSSTTYASVDVAGKIVNKNTTDNDQTVTLTASCTVGDVTKTATKVITLAKRTLTDIAIDGDMTIPTGGVANYVCTATWSYGEATTVTPTWSVAPTTYASVSTAGAVTNQNTTTADQTVTLTASYTLDGTTKTATKSITLAKKTLVAIAIAGDATIATASSATYTCTATWSYGDSTAVTPTWSLSATTYASVDADGKVVNKNTTDEDKTVTLTASYKVGDVTKTATKDIKLSKRTLQNIVIDGDTTIPTGGFASYTCTAIWSYGDPTTATPAWTLSNTTYASVDATGKVMNKNTTGEDQTVTLNATFTSGDITQTSAKDIKLAKRTLEGITIDGVSRIASGEASTYSCSVTWSDGTTSKVKPEWSLLDSPYASVDVDGKVTNKNTTGEDKSVMLVASYVFGDVTKKAQTNIILSKRTLSELSIAGDGIIPSGGAATYVCIATWSDGEQSNVVPTWSLSSTKYATVDADGKVTNKNTTLEDQTLTLTAAYTFGDVTKTASKTIVLTNRSLVSVSIAGDDVIPSGGVATYVCTATWSDGTTSTATAAWSIAPAVYVSVDATGKVTNRNTTATDQTVTLTASYEAGNVTKTTTKIITLEKRSLENIVIDGDATIATGGTASYTSTAVWSYGDSTAITPTWSLSSTNYASVDATGKVTNKNATDNDQTVTLTASYTVGNVTKTATKVITLSKRTLTEIVIEGIVTIASGETANYTCKATWSYGDSTAITPTWSLTSTTYASVDATGKVTNKNATDNDQTVILTASYTVGDVTKTSSKVITLAKRTLTDIAIDGDTTIPTGGAANYTCTATWSYGDSAAAVPVWSLSATTYASVDADGKVVNKNSTDNDQTVTLMASYTVGNVTKTATKAITLAQRTLMDIAIDGDATIASGGVASYVCTATWSSGDPTEVTPTWSLSATTYASVDANGKVSNKNAADEDQTVTLTASYKVGDVTKTAIKVITLAKRTLENIAINGDSVIPTGGFATYTCTASWSDGDPTAVMPNWSLSSTTYATIDPDGKIVNKNTTDEDQAVTLSASYTVGDVTKTASKVVTLAKRLLTEIAIDGDTVIPTGGTATYTCTATWSYGDSTAITPAWSLSATTYASVDTDGKVTNKNMTNDDQTVTLKASYTVGDVTKTAAKVITLSKRSLENIAIDGDATIPTGGTASYICTATWSCGDPTVFTPAWSLSATTYASVDADGKVTNKNMTNDDQTVTLKASYTVGDVTKTATKVITLAKRMLKDIAIDGDATIASGGTASYICTATWSSGDSTAVKPTWSLSSANYASVDADGKITNKNTTNEDQAVTLTASYTVGNVTKTATKVITLSKRTLTDIAINGDTTIATGGTATYTCTATWSYGDPMAVTPAWSLSSSAYASIDADGKVTNKNATDNDQTVTLKVSYTVGDVTKTATKVITLSKRTLTDIAINGDAAIATDGTATYTCTATWSYGDSTAVTPAWGLSSMTYASIDAGGKVTNKNASDNDQTVTLTASLTVGDVTKTATKVITLLKRSLTDIIIAGDDNIPTGGVASYICRATWSYGDSTAITPAWSLSSTTYASIDADGKVTNKNATDNDQTVTLMASCTVGDVTKTATKVITLSKRTLMDITIAGDMTIASGGTASYTCKATWSYGDSTAITPMWSLSATTYASIDADGKIANKNTTDNDQTVTLAASYTVGDVMKTATKEIILAKRTLVELSIIGDGIIPSGGASTYICTAAWSDGEHTNIVPAWSLSATNYAIVDADGKVTNKNTTDNDQTVTLMASYTFGDVTKTASRTITLTNRTLVSISIAGDDVIPSGGVATYVCTATWSDGATSAATAAWSLEPATYGSVDALGKVTNRNTTATDQTVTLTASYEAGKVTKTATKVITLSKRTMVDIVITGDSAIATGGSASYTCTATWSYGDATAITPTWRLSSTNYASVDATGKVTNRNATDNDQTVTLTASYTVGDVTKTATKDITLSKRKLTDIAIDGDANIPTGGTASYICTATWSNGDPAAVTPTWSLSSTNYASVDATGKVTNKNATDKDQTVTLTATYMSSDVTKTATKVITLSKRTLTAIAITGETTIASGKVASYACTATWSYGDTTAVTPTWSLSATTHASVDADGKVANKNTTNEDQAVTLTANYTVGNVTKTATKVITLSKRTLTEIVIDGIATIASGETVNYTCTATWSYGDSTAVTPAWSLSSTTYASIDADGKVTNKNATDNDQAVTLAATCTVGDVTKTATKVITLSKRTLTEIVIAGDDIIPTGGVASYTCTASWSYGDSTAVTPTWSLSSTAYASIDADGKVTNRNTTDEDQTVTLNASYEAGNATKANSIVITLAKRTLESVAVEGDEIIPTGGVATYLCTATWSYGDSSAAIPTWTLSNTTYASVDVTGKVTNKNTTDEDQTVLLTASYTVGDVTKTATKVITLSKRMLTDITINGNTAIVSGGFVSYTCTATWSSGESTTITPTWSLSSTNFANVDMIGNVTNTNTTGEDQMVTLTASYSVGDVTKTATKEIVLAKRTLVELSIAGDGIIPSGSAVSYTCTATWSDGEQSNVTPTWSLSSTNYASVDADGKVTNRNTTDEDQTLMLTASYRFGDATKTASKTITLTNRTLVSISIAGNDTIPSGGVATYVCTATWSDGATSAATAAWSIEPAAYASVDASGRVTNRNTTATDQTVTLTASYEAGNVTKTATKVITLSKRTIMDIVITGDSTIASGEMATYVCTATWSYGDSKEVKPTWSLSSTAYASVDAEGKVANKNLTDENQTVTLTASYTSDDVTKTATTIITLSKRMLTEIAITGDETIPTAGNATYVCSAKWSSGDPTAVMPMWSLSSTNHASVDADGKVVNKNTTDADQTVTLIASYTVGDMTKTATKVISLAKRTLTEVVVNGDETIDCGKSASYACTAIWSYGESTTVTPSWSLSSTTSASVDKAGKVTNQNTTDKDQMVTLTATYTSNDETKTATKVITLSKRTLMEIVVNGNEFIDGGKSANYTCTAIWNYGESTLVTPVWRLSSNAYASVDADGKVTNKNMTTKDQTLALTAVFSDGDVTKTASIDITLKCVAELVQILKLHPGWNMVALTQPLKDNADGVQKFLSLRPMMLSADRSSFVICGDATAVKPGVGYWVYSRSRQSIELAQDMETPVSQVNLTHGWNFVGILEDSDWKSSDVIVWAWVNGRFKQIDKSDMRAGRAYWVYYIHQ